MWGKRLVRIRIYWIIGFTGFVRLAFDWQALARIRLGGIFGYGKSAIWVSEILKIPLILKILILTKARGRPNRARRHPDYRLRGNDGGRERGMAGVERGNVRVESRE